MKTKAFLFLGIVFLFVGGIAAQTEKPVKQSEKLVVGGKVSSATNKPAQSGAQVQDSSVDTNKPASNQSNRIHTKNRSNGHSFSGKGNGKKHNLADPQPAIKDAKKNPKALQKE